MHRLMTKFLSRNGDEEGAICPFFVFIQEVVKFGGGGRHLRPEMRKEGVLKGAVLPVEDRLGGLIAVPEFFGVGNGGFHHAFEAVLADELERACKKGNKGHDDESSGQAQ